MATRNRRCLARKPIDSFSFVIQFHWPNRSPPLFFERHHRRAQAWSPACVVIQNQVLLPHGQWQRRASRGRLEHTSRLRSLLPVFGCWNALLGAISMSVRQSGLNGRRGDTGKRSAKIPRKKKAPPVGLDVRADAHNPLQRNLLRQLFKQSIY